VNAPSVDDVRARLAAVLPGERVGHQAARDGLPDLPIATPASLAEATEVLRLARAERWALLPVGSGSKLGWARPPARCQLLLASTNLCGVTAYEPGDGTLTARAGTRWSELEDATRARHHLSPEVPGAAAATLGGVLGAGASGLDRLRYGPLRHQVLGVQALQADGTLVKSGGRVVKNVTGYDLHRLWCGSQGSLCFVVEATLRLAPAQSSVAVLRWPAASLAEGLARAHALHLARLQPFALVLEREAGAMGGTLSLVLAGRDEAVASEVARAEPLLSGAEHLEGEPARRARAALRERELAGGRWAPLVLTTRPSRLAGALARLDAAAAGLTRAPALVVHPLLGSASACFAGNLPSDEALARLALALAQDSELVVETRGLGRHQRARALSGPALALMQRLQRSLDPHGVFARGRFHDEL
jgi:glycolate oxidase FAD binding subunit